MDIKKNKKKNFDIDVSIENAISFDNNRELSSNNN